MPEMKGPGRGGGYWNEPRGRGGRGHNDYKQDSHPQDDHYGKGIDIQHSRAYRDDAYRQDEPYGRNRRGEEPQARGGTYNQDRSSHPYSNDRRDDPYAFKGRGNHPMMDRRHDPYTRDIREDPYSRDPQARNRRNDSYNRDSYPRDVRGDTYGRDRMDAPYARDVRGPSGRGDRENLYPARRDGQDGLRGHPNDQYPEVPRSQPSQDKPMGGLLEKVNNCAVKDDDDAKLATSVITSLVKSLKDYNTISGKPNIASLMTEVELSIHKAKAMRVALKVLGSGPQTGQTAPRKY